MFKYLEQWKIVNNKVSIDESLVHKNIFELPGVFKVKIFLFEVVPCVLQWIPISVVPAYRTNVLVLNFKASFVVHFITFNQACFWVFKSPYHSSNNSWCYLEGGCVLVWSSLASRLDVQLRSVPIGIFSMAIQQDSKLVHTWNHFFLQYFPIRLSWNFSWAHCLHNWGNSLRAGMVCVVASRSINNLIVVFDSEVVWDGNSLIMCN